ncbi:hypothetical protein RJ641_012873 [Dillenia turbinata]|uniref:Uncharacterized protein n=1 Tax=Dillenia turbinata TaxID=194707 RepID=A0AAN8Z2N1_9MAGN
MCGYFRFLWVGTQHGDEELLLSNLIYVHTDNLVNFLLKGSNTPQSQQHHGCLSQWDNKPGMTPRLRSLSSGNVSWLSFDPEFRIEREQMCCYLTRTTKKTHQLTKDNLGETPTYGG